MFLDAPVYSGRVPASSIVGQISRRSTTPNHKTTSSMRSDKTSRVLIVEVLMQIPVRQTVLLSITADGLSKKSTGNRFIAPLRLSPQSSFKQKVAPTSVMQYSNVSVSSDILSTYCRWSSWKNKDIQTADQTTHRGHYQAPTVLVAWYGQLSQEPLVEATSYCTV